MGKLSFGEYEVNGHLYGITTAEVNGTDTIVAVTDFENGIHYRSEILDDAEEIKLTGTVLGGRGAPDQYEEGVPASKMDDLTLYLQEGNQESFKSGLRTLGREILGPDSQRDDPEGQSSKTARKRMGHYF